MNGSKALLLANNLVQEIEVLVAGLASWSEKGKGNLLRSEHEKVATQLKVLSDQADILLVSAVRMFSRRPVLEAESGLTPAQFSVCQAAASAAANLGHTKVHFESTRANHPSFMLHRDIVFQNLDECRRNLALFSLRLKRMVRPSVATVAAVRAMFVQRLGEFGV